jgi:hypothetical protein
VSRRTPGLVAVAARRRVGRAALTAVSFVVASVTGTLLATAAPALAIGERGDPGGGLTWVQTVLIYVGIPVGVALVITFLVFLPSMVRGPRYRPGRPWTAGSVWFGGPPDAATALEAVTTLPAATVQGGGASARW